MELNKGQLYYYINEQPIKVLIGGRGLGKSRVQGLETYEYVRSLPRSRGAILGLTYNQILTKVLPEIIHTWDDLGLREHIDKSQQGHYVIGKKPPSHWVKPISGVRKYTNTISFFNGSYIELLSMDRKDLNAGGNYDWLIVDEVQSIPQENFEKEYRVAIRGNLREFSHHRHHGMSLTGTQPWTPSGQWVLEYEQLAKDNPQKYLFLERPSYDNIKVLGKQYFIDLKRTIPQMVYNIEIENQRAIITSNGFYPNFDEDKHTYFDNYDYNNLANLRAIDKIKTKDYDLTKNIEIALDFGSSVMTMLVGQENKQGNEFRFIDLIFETSETAMNNADPTLPKLLLQRVAERFIRKYGIPKMPVIIWGDHKGHSSSDKAPSSYQVLEDIFRQKKIPFINQVKRTNNPAHAKKYYIINDILKGGEKYPKIIINKDTCKGLIMSIQSSYLNKGEFTKDKKSERRNIPAERQTHFSDAFDYIIMGKYENRVNYSGSAVSSFGFVRA